MHNDFTIRVYALVINEFDEILLTNENYKGVDFTKFPGGGLEWGEGLLQTVKRELQEELNLENLEFTHFYTTDFFVESYFDTSKQVISIYYKVLQPIAKNTVALVEDDLRVRSIKWVKLSALSEQDVSFSIDKHVVMLINQTP